MQLLGLQFKMADGTFTKILTMSKPLPPRNPLKWEQGGLQGSKLVHCWEMTGAQQHPPTHGASLEVRRACAQTDGHISEESPAQTSLVWERERLGEGANFHSRNTKGLRRKGTGWEKWWKMRRFMSPPPPPVWAQAHTHTLQGWHQANAL